MSGIKYIVLMVIMTIINTFLFVKITVPPRKIEYLKRMKSTNEDVTHCPGYSLEIVSIQLASKHPVVGATKKMNSGS